MTVNQAKHVNAKANTTSGSVKVSMNEGFRFGSTRKVAVAA